MLAFLVKRKEALLEMLHKAGIKHIFATQTQLDLAHLGSLGLERLKLLGYKKQAS